jgi:hypothetical protein
MSKQATVSEKTTIKDRQRKLESRLSTFHEKAVEFLGDLQDEDVDVLPQFTGFDAADEDDSGIDDDSDHESADTDEDSNSDQGEDDHPEDTAVCLPSSFKSADIQRLGLIDIAEQEMKLRQGQANDSLMGLRMALGHKAVLYRTKVRTATTSVGKTRAWGDIKLITSRVNKQVRAYRRARKAMERLGADDSILERYQELKREHLKLSSDITDENRYGQRGDVLPWFWRLDGQNTDQDNAWMTECKSLIHVHSSYLYQNSLPYQLVEGKGTF